MQALHPQLSVVDPAVRDDDAGCLRELDQRGLQCGVVPTCLGTVLPQTEQPPGQRAAERDEQQNQRPKGMARRAFLRFTQQTAFEQGYQRRSARRITIEGL